MNYFLNIVNKVYNCLPPLKRLPIIINFMNCITYPLLWLNQNYFGTYQSGIGYVTWSNSIAYTAGQQVIGSDSQVYQCWNPNTGNDPTLDTTNLYWFRVSPNWIGATERASYTVSLLSLTFAINRYFNTSFSQPPALSVIYLTPNMPFVPYFTVGNSEQYCSYNANQIDGNIYIPLLMNSAVYNRGTSAGGNPMFIVYCPTAFNNQDFINKLSRFVNRYLQVGRTYKIIFY